jgi:hypothetical protein
MTEEPGRLTHDDPWETVMDRCNARIGFLARAITYITLLGVLSAITWAFAPTGVGDVALANLTLNQLLRPLIFTAVVGWIAIVLVRAAFNPSEDRTIIQAWYTWGWTLIVAGVVGAGA